MEIPYSNDLRKKAINPIMIEEVVFKKTKNFIADAPI
jgi:hypothetical protein